jgi:hypothetical protein
VLDLISPSPLYFLLDLVAADIDLNGTGLLRLTLIQASQTLPLYSLSSNGGTDSSYSKSSNHLQRKSSSSHVHEPQYSYLIMKCLSGHTDAVEWLKQLHRIKLDSLQNISTSIYRQRLSS